MEEVFNDILEKDEKILKVWKPNRGKFWWFWGLSTFVSVFWIPLIAIGFLFDGNGWIGFEWQFWLAFAITMGITLVCVLISIIAGKLWLKNRFYAYSGKRILIRGGIIGIDYKSLEFKSLTATVVKVSVLDKIVRRNTGTIKFGSPASPVLSMWSMGHSNQYMFNHIQKPYDTLREIKELINTTE